MGGWVGGLGGNSSGQWPDPLFLLPFGNPTLELFLITLVLGEELLFWLFGLIVVLGLFACLLLHFGVLLLLQFPLL